MKTLIHNKRIYKVMDTRYEAILEAISEGESFTIPEYCFLSTAINLDGISQEDADELLDELDDEELQSDDCECQDDTSDTFNNN